jgi:guanylate kinase
VLNQLDDLQLSVSATTRLRRAGEKEGKDYFFLSRREFLRRVEEGRFLEWAEYGNNLYGTPAAPVHDALAEGKDVLLEIELQGARQVMRRFPDAVTVFIKPPDLQELEDRLRNRNTETESDISLRMARAEREMEVFADDARRGGGDFDYAIVNDDVEIATEELRSIIEDIRSHDPMR